MRDYLNAIKARLEPFTAAGQPLEGVDILIEDAPELEALINKSLQEQGMLILIGLPKLNNREETKNGPANFDIVSEIAIGEQPTMWREADDDPTALDVAEIVLNKVQGLAVPGFGRLRVSNTVPIPDKQRQVYQLEIKSSHIVQKTS